ncbi:hypothetical protein RUM44_003664 [Polyplax serrata]|uniref:Uncharacterized protein n=1 Tax=Polyplax serrata TaxID=468196 RepID=A0ABR1AHP6_POLSC
MKNIRFEKWLTNRQCNEKWKFPDVNSLIMEMKCNQILSFSNYPIQTELHSSDVPISTCKFSQKNKNVVAVANENGIVCIQNVKKVTDQCFVQTHKNTVYDIAWMPQHSQFVTVSGDNSAKLWDCRESNINLISVFRGHKRSVRCVSFKPENTAVFATGSRDGSLMIWDARAQKKCATFTHHVPDQIISSGAGASPVGTKCGTKKPGLSLELLNCKSVTGLVFQNDNTLISCGSLDNIIRIWDMRKTYSRSSTNPVAKYQLSAPYSGFSYLCMNSMQSKLYANCMDSYIYCFNINSYDPEPVAAFFGHENGSFYVKSSVSFDGNYLVSGSSDENAYVWNTKGAELSEEGIKPFVKLSSHLAEVTCVEMSPDNFTVVTCSDDGTFRLWNCLCDKEKTDEVRRVDKATFYDVESVTAVKTLWKNKRKFDEMANPNGIQGKTDENSPHTKICRFYTANMSLGCICEGNSSQRRGVKRLSEEPAVNPSKRKAFAAQEHTPPRREDVKHLVTAEIRTNVTPERQPPPPLPRLASKRKLEDMPNFIEESNRNKIINCNRVLGPSNGVEKKDVNKAGSEAAKSRVSESEDTSKENQKVGRRSAEKTFVLGTSSPTSNLPNYIEDGTSPYIHRCPRIVQKENDWLTKLQESRRARTPELQKLVHSSPTAEQQQQKKKLKQSDHTLHKYFKVSTKPTDKSYTLQEIQKKSILIN